MSLASRTLLALVMALALSCRMVGAAPSVSSCADLDSGIWAQSLYETDPARYAALDPDGNGMACDGFSPGAAPALWTDSVPTSAEPATLVSVSDGDTITVRVGGQVEPVRLILIDTPETHDPNDPPECYGQEATAYLSWLLSLGGTLYLEADVSNRDRYDRLLRYVWLDFGDGEVYLVNEVMARSGYGALATFPPDLRYVEEIRAGQRFAREHDLGLWAGCQTDESGDTNELSGAQGIVSAQPAQQVQASGCDASYPDVCIPPAPPDLDCRDVSARRFTVLAPDPHTFDGDFDGVGCERD